MGRLLTTMWGNLPKYKVNLTFAKAHTRIHLNYRMNQPSDVRSNTIPIWIGTTGIGKSSSLKKMASDIGVRYCRWDARAQLFEDNLGIPDPAGKEVKQADGSIKKVTANMEAELLPIFETEPVLLEIGELPTASQDVLNQIREIIDGIFTNRPVSPTCMMVATGNPLTDDYTTVNAELCESIEERLHPYLIVPEKAEKFEIWSTIMAPFVYQFLLKHDAFVDDLSPRSWVEIAEKVQALMDAGITAAEIIRDVRPKLVDTMVPPLQKYIEAGYQPDKVPILGRAFLGADKQKASEYIERLTRWFKDNDRGFVGASKMDIARVLLQGGDSFVSKYPMAGEMFTAFMEICITHGGHDIAMSLLDTLYRSNKKHVSSPIMEKFRDSPALVAITNRFVKFQDKIEALQAAE